MYIIYLLFINQNCEKSKQLLYKLSDLFYLCEESTSYTVEFVPPYSPAVIEGKRFRSASVTNTTTKKSCLDMNSSELKETFPVRHHHQNQYSGLLRLLSAQILCDIELYFNGYSPVKLEKYSSRRYSQENLDKIDDVFRKRLSNSLLYYNDIYNCEIKRKSDSSIKRWSKCRMKIDNYIIYFTNESDESKPCDFIDIDSITSTDIKSDNEISLNFLSLSHKRTNLLKFSNSEEFNTFNKIINSKFDTQNSIADDDDYESIYYYYLFIQS